MKNRCINSKVTSYKNYGARGIKVCDRWLKFENFLADMGERPSDQHSIERIDNDGNYEPSNCKWATRAEQVNNKRNTRNITANGETLTLAEWARRLGCTHTAIIRRISTGMPEEIAVTKAIPERPNAKLTYQNEDEIRSLYPAMTMKKIAEKFSVCTITVSKVVHRKKYLNNSKGL